MKFKDIKEDSFVLYEGEKCFVYSIDKRNGTLGLENPDGISWDMIESKWVKPWKESKQNKLPQRVIKFRAWDKTENAMVGGGKGDTLDFIADFDGYRSPDGISNNDFIWEEFTGLLDKNGKEIYEGDIVLEYATWNDTKPLGNLKREVRFLRGCFVACREKHSQSHNHYEDTVWEVVGNIHEKQ